MTVNIEKTDAGIYVTAKLDNPQTGSLGSGGISVKCKDEQEAEKVKAKIVAMEQKIQAEINAKNANLAQGTKPAGVGAKLDKAV